MNHSFVPSHDTLCVFDEVRKDYLVSPILQIYLNHL
jgi:hypothetical protein